MKIRRRALATLTLAMLSLAVATPLRAERLPFTPSVSTNPQDSSWLLQSYFDAYESYRSSRSLDEADLALGAATELAKRYLALPEAQYISAVKALNPLSAPRPEAVAELALSLELAWEKKYLTSAYRAADISIQKQQLAAQLVGTAATIFIGARGAAHSLTGWAVPSKSVASIYVASQAGRLSAALTPDPHVPPPPSALLSRWSAPLRLDPVKEVETLLLEKDIAAQATGGGAALIGWSMALSRAPIPTTPWQKLWFRFGFPLFASTAGYVATETVADSFFAWTTERNLEHELMTSVSALSLSETVRESVPVAMRVVRDTLRLAAYREPDFLRLQVAAVTGKTSVEPLDLTHRICESLARKDEAPETLPVTLHARAESFVRGEISPSVNGILLQSAALLREQGSGLLNAYAEQALEVRAARFEAVLALCAKFREDDK